MANKTATQRFKKHHERSQKILKIKQLIESNMQAFLDIVYDGAREIMAVDYKNFMNDPNAKVKLILLAENTSIQFEPNNFDPNNSMIYLYNEEYMNGDYTFMVVSPEEIFDYALDRTLHTTPTLRKLKIISVCK
jgi:hypothetical protein